MPPPEQPDPELLDWLVSEAYLDVQRHHDRTSDPFRRVPVDEVAEEIQARRFAAADHAEHAKPIPTPAVEAVSGDIDRVLRQVAATTANGDWGLFRPGVHVLQLRGIISGRPAGYRPGDRLVWRPAGGGEDAWTDVDTGLPLGNSLAWPPAGYAVEAFPPPAPGCAAPVRRRWWRPW
jgi:hypothetical protein